MIALVDGRPATTLDLADRGLHYGDGLFETLLVRDGRIALWRFHAARLERGAAALRLPPPDLRTLLHEALRVAADTDVCVVKLILTRGAGTRGYAPPRHDESGEGTRIVLRYDAPAAPAALRLRWCEHRVADAPALAGIKHLNRLDQVLARGEWSDAAFDEGLVCATDGRVLGATAANLFALLDGALVTPAVDRAGIAGVCRAALLETHPGAAVRDVLAEELERADELFLTNAVRGVVPVVQVGTRAVAAGPVARAARAQLAALGFVPVVAPEGTIDGRETEGRNGCA